MVTSSHIFIGNSLWMVEPWTRIEKLWAESWSTSRTNVCLLLLSCSLVDPLREVVQPPCAWTVRSMQLSKSSDDLPWLWRYITAQSGVLWRQRPTWMVKMLLAESVVVDGWPDFSGLSLVFLATNDHAIAHRVILPWENVVVLNAATPMECRRVRICMQLSMKKSEMAVYRFHCRFLSKHRWIPTDLILNSDAFIHHLDRKSVV